MAALTGPRPLDQFGFSTSSEKWPALPMKGAVVIYPGAMVCSASDGLVKPAIAASGLKCLGVYTNTTRDINAYIRDNSAGADSALTVSGIEWNRIFPMKNLSGDPCAQTDVGKDCFMVDDQTVALTDDDGDRSRAGRIYSVDSDGVWVYFDGRAS